MDEGETLTSALARRDVLKLRMSVLKSAVDQTAMPQMNRFMRSELRTLPTVDVAALRRQQDTLAQEYRLLDLSIQQVNWTTDLVD